MVVTRLMSLFVGLIICVDESQMVSTTRIAVGQKSMPLIFLIISVNAFQSLHPSESKAFKAVLAKPLLERDIMVHAGNRLSTNVMRIA
jgi:hypothetical protein